MCLCVFVAVREGDDGACLCFLFVIMCFVYCDPQCAWDLTVGLKRKETPVTNSKLQSIHILFPFMEGVHTLP